MNTDRPFFSQPDGQPEVIRIEAPPSIHGPAQADIDRWLQGADVIDLGSPKRDQAIQPTTWHTDRAGRL